MKNLVSEDRRQYGRERGGEVGKSSHHQQRAHPPMRPGVLKATDEMP